MAQRELGILGMRLNEQVCKALNIEESRVRRIVIDSVFDEPVKVYVELFGTQMVQLDWDTLLNGGEVTVINEPPATSETR